MKKNINFENNNFDFYEFVEENFNKFTNSEKKFVFFLLSNKLENPFLSARKIADRIKINPSTIIRFAKKIGFKGYTELQRNLGKLLINRINYLSDVDKAKKFIEVGDENNIIQSSFKKTYSNILELFKSIDEKEIEKFSEYIHISRKKIIIANRSTYSVGHFFYFELNTIIKEVYFLSDYDFSYFDIFKDLCKKDIVIAISGKRYSKLTIDFARYAYKNKINVISITDSKVSPLSSLSSSCLFVPTQSTIFHNSNVTMMALVDAIIAQIFIKNKEKAIKRLEKVEKIIKENNITFLI